MASLKYYLCNEVHLKNFNYQKSYIRYGNGENYKTGLYINNNYHLECQDDNFFLFDYEIHSIKNIVAIQEHELLQLGKTYSVFEYTVDKYYILIENLTLSYISKKYFVDEDIWINMNEKEKKNLLEFNRKKIEEFKLEEQKIKNEKEKELKKIKNIHTIKEVCSAISKDIIISKTIYNEKIPKHIKLYFVFWGAIIMLWGLLTKQQIISIIGLISIVLDFIFLQDTKNIKLNEEYDVNINHYERLKFQNKLPIHLLGKIKLIENELIILNYKKVNVEILKLLQQSINLTIYISTNEEYYQKNKEEFDNKLNDFLDNTLKYIKTLKENREIETDFISMSISEDILKMIDKNNELFISMIKDNHHLTDIYQFK